MPSSDLAGTFYVGNVKSKVAGGFDNLCKKGSYEFGNIKVTSNSKTELAMGYEPMEKLWPTVTTCAEVHSLISSANLCPLTL